VAYRRDRPDCDGEGVADFGAKLVDEATGGEEADTVGNLKTDDDVAVVVVEDDLLGGVFGEVPAHEGKVVKEGLDEREDRAIHVIDGGSGEEKGADKPADVGLFRGGGGEARVRQTCCIDRHAVAAPAERLV